MSKREEEPKITEVLGCLYQELWNLIYGGIEEREYTNDSAYSWEEIKESGVIDNLEEAADLIEQAQLYLEAPLFLEKKRAAQSEQTL